MSTFTQKSKEIFGKIYAAYKKVEEVVSVIYRCIFKLRKVIMAIPVLYLTIKIAVLNMQRLPEAVGLNIQSTGEFALYVTRNYAVYGPVFLTLFCLVLMFFSRKTVFPWIISLFSLVLPYLLYITNLYQY